MNKTAVTEQLLQVVWDCQAALAPLEDPYFKRNETTLKENLERAARAWSGSWLGYHANVYYRDLAPPEPGDHFSSEWGFMDAFSGHPVSSNWAEYKFEAIRTALFVGVDEDYQTRISEVSERASRALAESHDTLQIVLNALIQENADAGLGRIRDDLEKVRTRMTAQQVIKAVRPSGQFMSRDSLALSQGLRTPAHIVVHAEEVARWHPFSALERVVACARSTKKFMEINDLLERTPVGTARRIFIGHGRSSAWRELKDFIQERLRLEWDEFNREAVAGVGTTERLQAMLDAACFALIIMTAEDQHADASLHARENVIHEVGLFQGRLGFRRAIVLLEEGCNEFSNIAGLGQVRFPSGRIGACFEELRRVLEREGLL